MLTIFDSFELNLEGQSLNDNVNYVTINLLAKGITTLQNLEVWIELFHRNIKKNQNQWSNLLTNSLREWWVSDYFDKEFTGKCYHRKVIWFLHPSRYNSIEEDFRKVFKELVESNADRFHFDNKCWDEDSRNKLKNCVIESLSKQDGSIDEWTWLLSLIIKIPSKQYCQNNLFFLDALFWTKNNIVSNEDEKEEKVPQNKEGEHDIELFKKELEYCVACIGWKEFLTKCQQIKILADLWKFIQKTLKILGTIIKDDKLTFSLCGFLKKDENEERIRKLGENVIGLSKLDLAMEKFVDYKKLTDNFMIVLCNCYYLSDFEIKFEKEKKLLSDSSKEFQLMVDREKSDVFHIMWNKRQAAYNPNLISTIDNLMDVFKQADLDWNNLISKIKNNTLQYIDLEPYQITNWKLEMNILFPDTKHQEKDTIQTYVLDIENAFYFLQTKEHWRLLKNSTMIIQNIHKIKILKDNEMWQDFVYIIAQSEQKKNKASIKEASEWYLKCKHYFGDISNKKDVLEPICNNEKQIQALATNGIFTDQTQFEFTIQRMDDSQNEKFRQLVGALREINQTMRKIIWDATFQSICELAKAILTLPEQSNNFGSKLTKCLDMDFEELFHLMKEGDQLSVVKRLGQFEQAGQTGEWVLNDYETIFGLHQLNAFPNFSAKIKSKMDKYEGLTLQFGMTSLNCDSIENTLDRLKLVLQYEICKEIYAIRIDYWERGGHDKKEKLILQAKDSIETFENNRKEWIDKLNKWKKECISLRNTYPGLAYFTMNEAQHLIEKMNKISSFDCGCWDGL
ncbi:hypothetical protein RFI_26398, partial [Reticulomyxa filosa]